MTYVLLLSNGCKIETRTDRAIKTLSNQASRYWANDNISIDAGNGIIVSMKHVAAFYPKDSEAVIEPGEIREEIFCEVEDDEEPEDGEPENTEPDPDDMDRKELFEACVAMGHEFDKPWNFQKKDDLVAIYKGLSE